MVRKPTLVAAFGSIVDRGSVSLRMDPPERSRKGGAVAEEARQDVEVDNGPR
jgi:hypothetical protein